VFVFRGELVMRKHRKEISPDFFGSCGDDGNTNSLLPKRVLRSWIACCGAAGLSACSVGPDFKFPETGLPKSYVTTMNATAAAPASELSGSVDLTQWWRSFRERQY
jgi:hypothetical protein